MDSLPLFGCTVFGNAFLATSLAHVHLSSLSASLRFPSQEKSRRPPPSQNNLNECPLNAVNLGGPEIIYSPFRMATSSVNHTKSVDKSQLVKSLR